MSEVPHRRNSLRYQGYDYTYPGGIFVTFCTHNRQQLFGSVDGANVSLSQFGEILRHRWTEIPQRFPGVAIDEFIVMPDHIHGILWFGIGDADVAATCSEVVQRVKILVQRDISSAVKLGAPAYQDKLWQRGFYDRVIRDDRELEHIRFYINTNPERWDRT